MNPTVVQSGFDQYPNPSGQTQTTLASNVTPGNGVLMFVIVSSLSDSVSAVSSPMGTFTKLEGSEVESHDVEAWWCPDVTSASRDITVTTASATVWWSAVFEVEGGIGAVSGGANPTSSPPAEITIDPFRTNDLVFACTCAVGGNASGPGGAWTELGGTGVWDSASQGNDVVYQSVPDTSAVTASWANAYLGSNTIGVIIKAPLAPVTFPVTVESDVAHGQANIQFAMSGVTSGQPIVVTVLGNDPANIKNYTLSDDFSTPYTWTLVENGEDDANSNACATWIGTGGAGTSGTVTVSGGTLSGAYVGGVALAAAGASTESGLLAVDVSTTGGGTADTVATLTMTPSESGEGALFFCSAPAGFTSPPSSPFVNTLISFGVYKKGYSSAYSSPASGSPLACAWVLAGSETWQGTALVLKSSAPHPPSSGMLLVA